MTFRPAAGRRSVFSWFLAATLAVALVLIAPAAAALSPPSLVGPPEGAVVDAFPAFGWNPVAGADRYEFELSADAAFNSDIANITTKNLRAALTQNAANGTYYWHVRAITSTGALGPWSETRTIEKAWTARPSLLSPSNGATITYPSQPFKLAWSAVPGAAKYRVTLATDPGLGSLVFPTVDTAATAFTLAKPLAPGTYYWGIAPLDADGFAGNPSTVASFTWSWPSRTSTTFTDLAAAPELVDPHFSWNPIPGAAGYEVEVNSSEDWATSSKVCCDPVRFGSDVSTIGTSLSPTALLANNEYYWRVRAIDPSGNAGEWNPGGSFRKTFANVPPVVAPSVKNLHMRDNVNDPGTDRDATTAGYQTQVPVITWDPVPGASSYQVDVVPVLNGACDWNPPPGVERWNKVTTTTAWTPLGADWNNNVPYPRPANVPVANDGLVEMVPGRSYCARVAPRNRDQSTVVYGDYTYLNDGTGSAFTWTGYPAGSSCGCGNTGYLGASDYVAPVTGVTTGRMPYFTWKPMAGKQSYFVLVSKDQNFTTLVDYGFTQIPAYAPRQIASLTGYPDETTSYYWAVLPASNHDGSGASGDPLLAAASNFQKQSAPPTLLEPANGAVLNGPTKFRWAPVEAARRYRFQVSQDPSFANPIHDVLTAATSYTSSKTYPADTVLYWRVRADADDDPAPVGLTWSATGTFEKRLPVPVPDADNATSGAAIPTWTWAPVPGAISYDMHVEESDGDHKYFEDLPSHAFTASSFTGTGIFKWQVRANFPSDTVTPVHGPYNTPMVSFAHSIPEPANAASELGTNKVLFTWSPRQGAKHYKVQVSTRADFASYVENTTTENAVYAPLLTQTNYTNGGTYYWRVAMVDADLNVGDFTAARTFALPKLMRLMAIGYPRKGYYTTITISATDALRVAVPGARVCMSGAGISLRCKLTGSTGRTSFYVRATRYGRVTVSATKTGYQRATLSLTVR